jgi:hypothetical protein
MQLFTINFEEFIFENYYRYTKINQFQTQEYKINHPRWLINEVKDYSIDCDFISMYRNNFSFLFSQNLKLLMKVHKYSSTGERQNSN